MPVLLGGHRMRRWLVCLASGEWGFSGAIFMTHKPDRQMDAVPVVGYGNGSRCSMKSIERSGAFVAELGGACRVLDSVLRLTGSRGASAKKRPGHFLQCEFGAPRT